MSDLWKKQGKIARGRAQRIRAVEVTTKPLGLKYSPFAKLDELFDIVKIFLPSI
ncbi:hypothetical protein [Leptospira semungkisensis]|uniref:hypothetical protein n=1 Tax=Leptospira semungkisensis TaxID=2484985 RepID=UPI0014385771|nr:hypothetical protein [Leptospira semungkisensis]